MRAVNGALGWLSSQSRPDLAVQTSLSQQCFPSPTVFNLMHANQAVRRAKQQADLKITVPYIKPEDLTPCFWSDAAFANTTDMKTQAGWASRFHIQEHVSRSGCTSVLFCVEIVPTSSSGVLDTRGRSPSFCHSVGGVRVDITHAE